MPSDHELRLGLVETYNREMALKCLLQTTKEHHTKPKVLEKIVTSMWNICVLDGRNSKTLCDQQGIHTLFKIWNVHRHDLKVVWAVSGVISTAMPSMENRMASFSNVNSRRSWLVG